MGYRLSITRGAQDDFATCQRQDKCAAADITVLLRELEQDAKFLECMIDEDYSDARIENVAPVRKLIAIRINGYRVKLRECRYWRMIFIVDRRTAQIGLFAIMRRDQNYERDTTLWQRIEREFDAHGFSKF